MTSLPSNPLPLQYRLTRDPESGAIEIHFSDVVSDQTVNLIEACLSDNPFVIHVARLTLPNQADFQRRLLVQNTFTTPVLASIRYLCDSHAITEVVRSKRKGTV